MCRGSCEDARWWLLLWSYFFTSLSYAIIIPASLALSERYDMPHGGAWSGMLIGAFFLSSIGGMVVFRHSRRLESPVSYKVLFAYPCAFRSLLNAALVPILISEWRGWAAACAVFVCRLLDGALNACQGLCALEVLTKTSPDRVLMLSCVFLLANVGLGGGMLLFAAIESGYLHGFWALGGVPTSWYDVPGALPALFMVPFWALYFAASLAVINKEDPEMLGEYTTAALVVTNSSDIIPTRKIVITASIVFGTCRALVNSGIDSASILVLETQWQWSRPQAAGAVGCCYLASVVWHAVFQVVRARGISDAHALHASVAICSLAVAGLFNTSSDEKTNVAMLLLSDSIMFPVFSLANSIVAAIMFRSCSLNEPFGGLENVIFLQKATVECVGLGLGPVVARGMLTSSGRNDYAMVQLALVLTAAGAWLFAIHPISARLESRAEGWRNI